MPNPSPNDSAIRTSTESNTAAPPVSPDLRCSGCGYLLRGLPSSGRCPECGQSIARSVADEQLRRHEAFPRPADSPLAAASSAWLLTALLGCGGLLLVNSGVFFALALSAWGRSHGDFSVHAMLCVAVLFTASVWLLTVPAGERVGDVGGGGRRWGARLLSLTPIAWAATLYVAEHVIPATYYDKLVRLAPVLLVLLPPLPVLLFLRLRDLATLLRDARLRARCMILAVTLCAGATAMMLMAFVESMDGAGGGGGLRGVVSPFASCGGLAGLAGWFYAIVIGMRFTGAFFKLYRFASARERQISP